MDNKYGLGLLGKGYENSGGWRFGSNTAMQPYEEEAYNAELLNKVGNPRGAVDKALAAKPIDNVISTGLLSGNSSSSGGNYDFGGSAKSTSGEAKASDAWGANAYGKNVSYDAMSGLKGFASLGPLGALAGLRVSDDPMGEFAYQALVAQEARDTANSLGVGLSGFGNTGGFNDSVTSGGDFGGSYGGGFGTGNEGAGFSDGISGGSFGDGGYGGGFGGDFGGSYGGDGSGAGGWAKGGAVTKERLSGPNPKGADDGYGALADGEYVIKASSVKKYGKGLLGEINAGTYKKG